MAIVNSLVGCSGDGSIEITDLEPRSGKLEGDQPIKIIGKNFRKTTGYAVYFGAGKAGSVTIMDDNTLVVSTPQHEREEQVDVTIHADNGEAFKITKAFQYAKATKSAAPAGGEKLKY